MKRRTRWDIYHDILDTIRRKGSIGITRISYGANLPVDRAREVVRFLVVHGLIKEEEYGGVRGYILTPRGGELLQALRTVNKYISKAGSEID